VSNQRLRPPRHIGLWGFGEVSNQRLRPPRHIGLWGFAGASKLYALALSLLSIKNKKLK